MGVYYESDHNIETSALLLAAQSEPELSCHGNAALRCYYDTEPVEVVKKTEVSLVP